MRSRAGQVAVVSGGLAALLAGCGQDGRVYFEQEELQPPLAVKPEGWILEEREQEMGPPPPGHPRIIGAVVPDWTPEPFEGRGGGLSWASVGPRPIASEYWSGEGNAAGRVVCIAPHPTDPATAYAVSASGGLWKTTDGGASWTPLTDQLSTLNGGAAAVHPANPNLVLLGTGEMPTGSTGDGLFRSMDAGATWSRIATAAQVGAQVSEIAVHPTDTNIIYVSGSAGCARTIDGGRTWSLRLAGSSSNVKLDPLNPTTVYVARNGLGVYKSTNSGGTFARLTGGLPTGVGDVHLAMCTSSPGVLYAAILSTGGALTGFYRTADGGVTWTPKPATPNFCTPQCWYDAYVAADPTNPLVVYCGGVDPRYATAGVIKSVNGGGSWAEVSQYSGGTLHPDHHAMAFGPGGVVWEGNDGGVWKSTNAGASWINCNNDLAISQMYNIVVHPNSPERMMGGTQDNGTPERTGDSNSWPELQVGDGGYSVFDFSGTTRRYTTYVYLSLTRWVGGAGANISGPWGSDATNWISPIVVDPNLSSVLVAGTNRVWRTANATVANPVWTAISTNAVGAGGTINVLAVARRNSRVIYSGSSTGHIFVTTDAATWTDRSTGLPGGAISDVIISPTSPGEAYVSTYSATGPRILRTENFGATWTNVTGTLPAGVGVTALEVDFDVTPHGLYAGYGAGIYCSRDAGATWTRNNSTLPNVNIGDLTLDRTRRLLVAGTYGRGAWRAALPVPCPADFNNDGFLDFFDYDDFVACFESGDCPPGRTADFNGDGFADFFDYDDFVMAFEVGC